MGKQQDMPISPEAARRKAYAMLGLAERAGCVVSGNFQVEEEVRRKKAALVIVASDAGPNTADQFRNKCAAYHVPLRFFGEKEMLGHVIGRELRSCVAVTEAGFAKNIEKWIDSAERGQNGEDEDQ